MPLFGITFDLDGTLGDTLPVCRHALREAFLRFTGRRYSDDEITAMFGPSEEGMIARRVPADRCAECLEYFLAVYDECHDRLARAFPEMPRALTLLHEGGVRLGVVTGKGPRSTAISLRHLGLVSYFDPVQHGSPEGEIKAESFRKALSYWAIPPAHAAHIGDTPGDLAAAKENGAMALGAAWADRADEDGLRAAAPQALFRTLEEFVLWIEQNVGGPSETRNAKP